VKDTRPPLTKLEDRGR
jgi:hypothetical protein